MKFQVLQGAHIICNDPLQDVVAPGVVESDRDLVAVFGDQKFKRLPDDEPVQSPEPKKAEKGVK
jgi:hypothetical protein